MKKSILGLISLVFFIILVTGCGLMSPFADYDNLKVPRVPGSLTGSDVDASRFIYRVAIPQDQWLNEYDQFIILPEIGNNYNDWLDDGVQKHLDDIRLEPEFKWSEVNIGIFTMEVYSKDIGSGSIIRSNSDFSEIEMYTTYENNDIRYLRVKKTAEYTHSILLMCEANGGGDSVDSVEIIKTADKKFLKCVRIHDMTTTPLLQHFVGITDLNSSNYKTTGRRRLESNRPDFTFSTAPGTSINIDYTSQEEMVGGTYYELYGFFNDHDNYVEDSHNINPNGDGYIDPQLLTEMYSLGLNNEIIGTLNINAKEGIGGIPLTEWDLSLFE